MNVQTLIRELQDMPRYAEVYLANHDNAEYEVSGDITSATLYHQHDVERECKDYIDKEIIPKDALWVTIQG